MAQLDFILECHIQDNPEAGKFIRGESPLSEPEILASWERVLVGKAKAERIPMPSFAALKVAANVGQAANMMRNIAEKPDANS